MVPPTPGATGGRSPSARHYYFMGKDNIVFHSVIWPSQLLGYGEGGEIGAGQGALQLPVRHRLERVPHDGGEAVLHESQRRRSTWAISSTGTTRMRSATSSRPAGRRRRTPTSRGSEFVRRNNDELVANWGNLVNRALASTFKNFGVVPAPGVLTAEDDAVIAEIEAGFASVGDQIERARFKAGLAEAMRLATRVNQYLSDQAPWAVIKTDTRAGGNDPVRRAALYRQPPRVVRTVPAVQLAAAPRAARPRRLPRRPAGAAGGRGRRAGSPTPFSPVTTRAGRAAGRRASFRSARSCASRGRSSRSSTRKQSSRPRSRA